VASDEARKLAIRNVICEAARHRGHVSGTITASQAVSNSTGQGAHTKRGLVRLDPAIVPAVADLTIQGAVISVSMNEGVAAPLSVVEHRQSAASPQFDSM